ncbi:CDKN1B [Mytilus coruscus]|uniref:CDKN1B n=1 Tax=Mytilus coruscus TaxID=42192 RepID=A0A6J7ZY91_MYTCO|nr:CDKN1B [Mytilus coruscus]
MQTFSTKSKVRRCLFGPPDHESIRKDLDKALDDNKSELREKWNYDFDKDVPLEGKYQWEVCEEKEYIPSFYTRDYPVKLKRKISDINTILVRTIVLVKNLRTRRRIVLVRKVSMCAINPRRKSYKHRFLLLCQKEREADQMYLYPQLEPNLPEYNPHQLLTIVLLFSKTQT